MQVATKEEKGTTSDFPVVLFFHGFYPEGRLYLGPLELG